MFTDESRSLEEETRTLDAHGDSHLSLGSGAQQQNQRSFSTQPWTAAAAH
ncbi:Hypothetical protein SMAX5B_001013 [Scophthalmus maximus]|uniref:Uncharacterized protein n=1 Tax=Scophthalmus maximus TaxID=52904 RepID=A0A2U9C192_SCOMX|nr:Hypothetical protein SMAX5B_001013 [Scophthalmus maximus]